MAPVLSVPALPSPAQPRALPGGVCVCVSSGRCQAALKWRLVFPFNENRSSSPFSFPPLFLFDSYITLGLHEMTSPLVVHTADTRLANHRRSVRRLCRQPRSLPWEVVSVQLVDGVQEVLQRGWGCSWPAACRPGSGLQRLVLDVPLCNVERQAMLLTSLTAGREQGNAKGATGPTCKKKSPYYLAIQAL